MRNNVKINYLLDRYRLLITNNKRFVNLIPSYGVENNIIRLEERPRIISNVSEFVHYIETQVPLVDSSNDAPWLLNLLTIESINVSNLNLYDAICKSYSEMKGMTHNMKVLLVHLYKNWIRTNYFMLLANSVTLNLISNDIKRAKQMYTVNMPNFIRGDYHDDGVKYDEYIPSQLKNGEHLYGFELEGAFKSGPNFMSAMQQLRNQGLLIPKGKTQPILFPTHDGSIRGSFCVEFVFSPNTFDWWYKNITPIINVLESWGFYHTTSHNNSGLHIHIDRRSFVNKSHIEAFADALVGLNSVKHLTIFGRQPNNYCVKRKSHTDRYSLVNLTKRSTVEVRGFDAKQDIIKSLIWMEKFILETNPNKNLQQQQNHQPTQDATPIANEVFRKQY